MPNNDDGLRTLHTRVERRARQTPAPKNPVRMSAVPAGGTQDVEVVDLTAAAGSGAPEECYPAETKAEAVAPGVEAVRGAEKGPIEPSLVADTPSLRHVDPAEPLANLAVRVRRSMDRTLGDLTRELQGAGIRTSKAELVEMLLWELPTEPNPYLRARLATFRHYAPREQQP